MWLNDNCVWARALFLILASRATIGLAAPVPDLEPRLLRDQTEMGIYLKGFPFDHYRRVSVKGLGEFYLDDAKDTVKEHLYHGVPWEKFSLPLLEQYARPGTTAIDAGAHIGTHTLTIARVVGPSGRVYAFEPQKKLFRELYYNMRLNAATNVVPLRFALGWGSKIIEMSPADAENEGQTAVGAGGDAAELRSIDSFGFEGVSFIKIDVEGMEGDVLLGARDTIRRCRPVMLVEILSPENYDWTDWDTKAKIDATIKLVEELGYRTSRTSDCDYLFLPKP